MEMWVFGYGSLLWKPGFDVAESVIGRLPGYARSFCMRSIHHRGTVEKPGVGIGARRDDGQGMRWNGAARDAGARGADT